VPPFSSARCGKIFEPIAMTIPFPGWFRLTRGAAGAKCLKR